MNIYVIYKKPKDYPDKFVLRRWEIGDGTVEPKEVVALANTLEEAMKAMPPGMTATGRYASDDPVIVGVWL